MRYAKCPMPTWKMVEAWAFVLQAAIRSCLGIYPARPVPCGVSSQCMFQADNRVQNTRREMHFAESGRRSASEWAGMAVAWGSFWLPTVAKMRSSLNPAIFWAQMRGWGGGDLCGEPKMSPARHPGCLVTPVRPDTQQVAQHEKHPKGLILTVRHSRNRLCIIESEPDKMTDYMGPEQ